MNTKKIKYPYLPNGREIKYVSIDNEFMASARDAAKNLSTENNHPTGAVVVKNGKIIGQNGNQSGFKNKKLQELHKGGLCVRKWIGAKSGTLYWTCPGCAPFSSHAEQMAIKNAVKNGENTQDADLYLYGHWWACEPCWDRMVKAGIKNVFLLENSEVLFDRDNKDNIIHSQFNKSKGTLSLPDVQDAIKQIENPYHEQLHSEIRYERFLTNESKDEWKRLLGDDVSFAGHPYATLDIIEEYISLNDKLNEEEKSDLRTVALIHDWGELKINGEGVGDISYSFKTSEDEKEETKMFLRIIDEIKNENIKKHLLKIYKNVVLDRNSELGRIFNSVERIGYLQTAIRAYKGFNEKHITNWRDLTGNVFSNQITALITYSQDDAAVKKILDTKKDTLTEILSLDWESEPFDADCTDTKEKFKNAQITWIKYIS